MEFISTIYFDKGKIHDFCCCKSKRILIMTFTIFLYKRVENSEKGEEKNDGIYFHNGSILANFAEFIFAIIAVSLFCGIYFHDLEAKLRKFLTLRGTTQKNKNLLLSLY